MLVESAMGGVAPEEKEALQVLFYGEVANVSKLA